jgi:hypothetical protein
MAENVIEHEKMLEEFEMMFMHIQGELDFASLKTKSEI